VSALKGNELGIKAMHRQVEQAAGSMHCGNTVKLMEAN
jgi:hypothetical protein